jgi:hypothetical protein
MKHFIGVGVLGVNKEEQYVGKHVQDRPRVETAYDQKKTGSP